MEPGRAQGAQVGPGVLVVDDYAPNLTALRALLAPIADVTTVNSGARALEEVRCRDYAVVVLDVQMPLMDGIEVARRIRSGDSNAQVPIIFLTAMDSAAMQILDGYAAGAVDYLRRPIEPLILKSKVSIFVELQARREQARREAAERVRLEAERAAAERVSREKDQFLAVLSHELRTPLTSILLWTDMLLNKVLTPEMVRRGLETVDICARHESHMVENVLEMSRLVTGTLSLDLAPVDVNDLIEDAVGAVAGLAAERQVRIVCPSEPVAWRAVGDRMRLRRILCNLLENAVNFTPAGGRVEIVLGETPSAFTIGVRDTGIGFTPELAPRLFSRFNQGNASSTRVRGGLGLGLALAKALIERHGGSIAAESEGAGRGASFTVTLPREPVGLPAITA
jgi:signal transduction histidine kinase